MLLNKINLDIDYDYFLNADYTQHSGSCLILLNLQNKKIYMMSILILIINIL